MSSSTLIAGLVTGLLLGGLFAICALGLSLVFGIMRLVNVVHGELLVLAAYLNFTLGRWAGVDPLLSLLILVPIMFGFGFLIQKTILNPLMNKGDEAPLLTAFGLSIIAQNLFLLIWKADTRSLNTEYTGIGLSVAGIQIPFMYLLEFGIAIVLILLVHLFMRKTFMGKAMRAAALDADTARVMGINPKFVYAFTYGLGSAVAALGGTLVAMTFSFVPTTGLVWLLKGFVVVVLGGLGSVFGTLGAGFLLGAAEGLGGAIFGTGYRELVGYIIFLIVLIMRPSGLFGRSHG